MRSTSPKYDLLRHPQFLLGLLMLLFNDLLLKPFFHNGLTGKLSDIIGLYIFPVFCCAFFPAYKKHIYCLTAILFALWKSALSQPLIDTLNNIHISINRTIDPSDLIALLALPVSYKYYAVSGGQFLHYISPKVIAITALCVFCNDSIAVHTIGPRAQHPYGKGFKTKLTKEQLFARFDSMGIKYYPDSTISGRLFFDTSSYALTRIVEDNRHVYHFWRMKNYTFEQDTIKNINFLFLSPTSGNRLFIDGYDIDSVKWELNNEEYNKQRRKYNRMIKVAFSQYVK